MKIEDIKKEIAAGKEEILEYALLSANAGSGEVGEEDLTELMAEILNEENSLCDITIYDSNYYEWETLCHKMGIDAWETNIIHVVRNKRGAMLYHFVLSYETNTFSDIDDLLDWYHRLSEEEDEDLMRKFLDYLPVDHQKELPVFYLEWQTKGKELVSLSSGHTFHEAMKEFRDTAAAPFSEKNAYHLVAKEGGTCKITNLYTEKVFECFEIENASK